jgi:pimeloyl-ACP methyl ester carboxylesterase
MIALGQMGSFFVGGRRIRVVNQPLRPVRYSATFAEDYDPNGSFLIEAAYVQFFLPAVRRFETSLLLIHGGGLTGAQWDSTPDGRVGWLPLFLEAGVACYVIDNVERGRAGFCAIDGEWPDRPLIRSDEEATRLYRFGYSGHKFPIMALDHLSAQTVPRWPSTGALQADAVVHAIDRIGPCALLGFSQGGGLAFRAADRRRETVKACLSIEPHGVPTTFGPGLPGTPAAMVLGDFIEEDASWRGLAAAGADGMAAWRAAGGTAEIIRLPACGITGNTHMMMMDTNSDDVFGVLLNWLDDQHRRGRLP